MVCKTGHHVHVFFAAFEPGHDFRAGEVVGVEAVGALRKCLMISPRRMKNSLYSPSCGRSLLPQFPDAEFQLDLGVEQGRLPAERVFFVFSASAAAENGQQQDQAGNGGIFQQVQRIAADGQRFFQGLDVAVVGAEQRTDPDGEGVALLFFDRPFWRPAARSSPGRLRTPRS